MADIEFELRDGLAVVTLNRPKAFNALTLDMIHLFAPMLTAWRDDPTVGAVVIKGAGDRAFCAGGDIIAIHEAGPGGSAFTREFFSKEYALNRLVHDFPKPYISFLDGFVMGGGVGISVHGSHRVATERTLFSMPETGIGFFPDVGGSYFLPRLPGELGPFLGLTGSRLKAADCLYAGIATHDVELAQLPEVERELRQALGKGGSDAVAACLSRFQRPAGESHLAAHRAAIDRCFAGDRMEDIMAALRAEGSAWADDILSLLELRSPFSLKIALKQIRKGSALAFDEAMKMEYRLSQALLRRPDFFEGVRALLIDKDNRPRWQPARLQEVEEAEVETCFASRGEAELRFV